MEMLMIIIPSRVCNMENWEGYRSGGVQGTANFWDM